MVLSKLAVIVVAAMAILFVVLFVAKKASAQVPPIDFAKEEQGVQISVRPYENSPFLGGGERSNAAVLMPPEIKAVETIVVFLHGFDTAVSDSAFVAILSDALEGASPEAILIAPQLALKEKSGDSGRLKESGRLERLIDEVLTANNLAATNPEVIVVSYSGGYRAAIDCLKNNPGLNISSVVFMDTLYWRMEEVLDWYREDNSRKVVIIYSQEERSQAALKLMNSIFEYTDETRSYTDAMENPWVAGDDFWRRRLLIIETDKKHEEIPKLLGPMLKQLQNGGG